MMPTVEEETRDEQKKEDAPKDEIDELMLVEDREKGNISFATFYQYFQVTGGFWFFFIIIFLLVIWSVA
jgi:hypothetical protein